MVDLSTWKDDFMGPQTASAPAGQGNGRLDLEDLSGADRNAAAALLDLFNQYDLGTLGAKIVDYVKRGYDPDTIALLLQDTKEWKARFSGNEARKSAGLPVLNPAEYLSTERSYRQILQQYGFPKGFYDTTSDFAGMIGRDLSPAELGERAQIYSSWAMNNDPAATSAARRLYGFGIGEIAAYAMDPVRALPLLQKQAKAVSVATAAARRGMDSSRARAEYLVDAGVDQQSAEAGYSQISQLLPTFQQLGNIYDEDYDQTTAEDEFLLGSGAAADTRKRLASQERAAFAGSSRGSVGKTSRSY